MGKSIKILDFFERKNTNNSKANTDNTSLPTSSINISIFEKSKSMQVILFRWYVVNIE